jgi:hypothetical protein
MIITISLIHTHYKSLQYTLSLLRLSSLAIARLQLPTIVILQLPCSRPYQLVTVLHRTHCSKCWLPSHDWLLLALTIWPRHRTHRKHCFQQFLHCCVHIGCRGNCLPSWCLAMDNVFISHCSLLRPLLCKRFVSRHTRRQNAICSVKQREPMGHFMHCCPSNLPSRSERHAVVSYRMRRQKVA